MLHFNNRFIGGPFSVTSNGDQIVIEQEDQADHRVQVPVEDVDDLIRKINHVKNEIICLKVREANKELFS